MFSQFALNLSSCSHLLCLYLPRRMFPCHNYRSMKLFRHHLFHFSMIPFWKQNIWSTSTFRRKSVLFYFKKFSLEILGLVTIWRTSTFYFIIENRFFFIKYITTGFIKLVFLLWQQYIHTLFQSSYSPIKTYVQIMFEFCMLESLH